MNTKSSIIYMYYIFLMFLFQAIAKYHLRNFKEIYGAVVVE
jgi:hypothetical protein